MVSVIERSTGSAGAAAPGGIGPNHQARLAFRKAGRSLQVGGWGSPSIRVEAGTRAADRAGDCETPASVPGGS